MFIRSNMKVKCLIATLILMFVSGCVSTGNETISMNNERFSTSPVKVPKNFQVVKLKHEELPLVSNYVYRAALQAKNNGYKKFLLVQEFELDEGTKILDPTRLMSFMFNEQSDLDSFENMETRTKKYKVLGVFETSEFSEKRYVPIGSMPGVA
ncbi:hypothetical protein C9I89_22270 [Photobacterium lipolyticum]|uniref:Lipoprotein n=2 Tax=Photobacterium lipolyticum TaxID=266810 RepID=A0A2T3MKQ4_9GAMM|nr:hypothetical protein C9I89_22270 [Photobacterium lipolyticum]